VLLIALTALEGQSAFANETKEYGSCNINKIEDCHSEKSFLYSDDDVDMLNYQIPKGFDANKVVEAITTGDGWIKLEGMYSEEDVLMARERIYHHNKADKIASTLDKHESRDELHNKYSGIVWALFNKGRIFEKMGVHPAILNVSSIVLGEASTISSFAANTVLPGQGGQLPHLDYPYYRFFYPSVNPTIMDNAPPMSVQFVTLLTDFTKDNGGTAIRPNSHKLPRYPDDEQDFYKHALQMEGKAGDVVVFAGAMQHCAMPNNSKGLRAGILQHMAPVYVKPFEAMAEYVRDDIKARATPDMKRILALEHPYPVLKN